MNYINQLFETTPSVSHFPSMLWLLGFSGLILLIAIVSMIYIRTPKSTNALRKVLKPLVNILFWFAIVGLLLTVIRLNGIPYLSMRFILILFVLAFIWYVIHVIKVFCVDYPRVKEIRARYNVKKEDPYLKKVKKKKK